MGGGETRREPGWAGKQSGVKGKIRCKRWATSGTPARLVHKKLLVDLQTRRYTAALDATADERRHRHTTGPQVQRENKAACARTTGSSETTCALRTSAAGRVDQPRTVMGACDGCEGAGGRTGDSKRIRTAAVGGAGRGGDPKPARAASVGGAGRADDPRSARVAAVRCAGAVATRNPPVRRL